MSVKGSWPRGKSSSYCVRNCNNRDRIEDYSFEDILIPEYDFCKDCFKYSNYVPNN